MSEKILMKGNEALVRGAIAGGCRAFFGYPITPQNEVPEYMSRYMPEADGVFIQAESEVAAVNMVYGAASAGIRAMTSSSSPGVSLKMEGISYMAGAQLPCVIANMQRGGPGLGNIAAAQGDYFQAVKGGGHGDYRLLVLAPWSVMDMFEFTAMAFSLADKYRNPVMILSDGIIGQMIEPIIIPDKFESPEYDKPWAANGAKNRKRNYITSLYMAPETLEVINLQIQAKYVEMKKNEVRYQEFSTDDADLILVAYGSSARICLNVVKSARENGLKVGLFRPITLYPYPYKRINEFACAGKRFLVIEKSAGQMVEDVMLAVNGKSAVDFYGKLGGMVLSVDDILAKVDDVLSKPFDEKCSEPYEDLFPY